MPDKIVQSPSTKRKAAEPEESKFEQCETNNRAYTNCLRKGLDIIAELNNDRNKTAIFQERSIKGVSKKPRN